MKNYRLKFLEYRAAVGKIALSGSGEENICSMSYHGDIYRFSTGALKNMKESGMLDLWFDEVESEKKFYFSGQDANDMTQSELIAALREQSEIINQLKEKAIIREKCGHIKFFL